MKSTLLDGLYVWSMHQPDRGIDFNGYFWQRQTGNVLIDPLPIEPWQLEKLRGLGGAAWVIVTNADHLRASVALKEVLEAKLVVAALEREALGPKADAVDVWLWPGGELPDGLRADVLAVPVRGSKSPGELALYLRPLQAVLFGDAVRSHASGRLDLLPDDKLTDKPALLESLRPLVAQKFDAVLLGDGDPIFRGGREALCHLIETVPGCFFNRIHLDKVRFVTDDREPGSVTASAELSRHMTLRKLGFHLEIVGPGNVTCAYHHESAEEEVFFIRKGSMTVRTPYGEFPVGPGDIFAFPCGPNGTHQFRNDGEEPCEFFALSNLERHNLCYYPDSDKVAVNERREMYRVKDKVRDYWEGDPTVPRGRKAAAAKAAAAKAAPPTQG